VNPDHIDIVDGDGDVGQDFILLPIFNRHTFGVATDQADWKSAAGWKRLLKKKIAIERTRATGKQNE
jgi:hypothetical protein